MCSIDGRHQEYLSWQKPRTEELTRLRVVLACAGAEHVVVQDLHVSLSRGMIAQAFLSENLCRLDNSGQSHRECREECTWQGRPAEQRGHHHRRPPLVMNIS